MRVISECYWHIKDSFWFNTCDKGSPFQLFNNTSFASVLKQIGNSIKARYKYLMNQWRANVLLKWQSVTHCWLIKWQSVTHCWLTKWQSVTHCWLTKWQSVTHCWLTPPPKMSAALFKQPHYVSEAFLSLHLSFTGTSSCTRDYHCGNLMLIERYCLETCIRLWLSQLLLLL